LAFGLAEGQDTRKFQECMTLVLEPLLKKDIVEELELWEPNPTTDLVLEFINDVLPDIVTTSLALKPPTAKVDHLATMKLFTEEIRGMENTTDLCDKAVQRLQDFKLPAHTWSPEKLRLWKTVHFGAKTDFGKDLAQSMREDLQALAYARLFLILPTAQGQEAFKGVRSNECYMFPWTKLSLNMHSRVYTSPVLTLQLAQPVLAAVGARARKPKDGEDLIRAQDAKVQRAKEDTGKLGEFVTNFCKNILKMSAANLKLSHNKFVDLPDGQHSYQHFQTLMEVVGTLFELFSALCVAVYARVLASSCFHTVRALRWAEQSELISLEDFESLHSSCLNKEVLPDVNVMDCSVNNRLWMLGLLEQQIAAGGLKHHKLKPLKLSDHLKQVYSKIHDNMLLQSGYLKPGTHKKGTTRVHRMLVKPKSLKPVLLEKYGRTGLLAAYGSEREPNQTIALYKVVNSLFVNDSYSQRWTKPSEFVSQVIALAAP
jgi:hypothetical protein